MVKIVVQLAKVVIAVVVSVLCFSCGFDFNVVNGTGNVTTQDRTTSETFNSVSAGRGLEVIIEQGNVTSVKVEADENLQEHIKTTVKGNELTITADVNIGDAESKKVTVVLPEIKKLEAAGGSSVNTKGTIKSDKLKIDASSGSFIEAKIDSGHADCETSSGSSITLMGTTNYLNAKASSGSNIDAAKLNSKKVKSGASSGAHITVNPSLNLSADASSGGHVYYINTPDKLEKDESSGGSVSQK
ncbi:head GIN domain-containing protein [Flavobacterium sp. NRK1]|uniref:head GIN domain-containing protein n=1 Tax=Flavobacterium sp. NRK1 TaxID=2954929 RepID=UPI0020935747|nr:head GIN domain-containing protein [Flavobacterium sp. NRK1]MCO6146782.1 DUF2807 domain-containing protein [Flavobacterium sp. NRK1]